MHDPIISSPFHWETARSMYGAMTFPFRPFFAGSFFSGLAITVSSAHHHKRDMAYPDLGGVWGKEKMNVLSVPGQS